MTPPRGVEDAAPYRAAILLRLILFNFKAAPDGGAGLGQVGKSPLWMNCTIRLPSAVPSVGPANTVRPVALAVCWFR